MASLTKEEMIKKFLNFKRRYTLFPHINLLLPFKALKNEIHLLTEHDINRSRAVTRPFNMVLDVLDKAGMKLNSEKCIFTVKVEKFLGYIISFMVLGTSIFWMGLIFSSFSSISLYETMYPKNFSAFILKMHFS